MPMQISKDPPGKVHKISFECFLQWAIIGNLLPGMFAKDAINRVVSVLGTPLHTEFINTMKHTHSIRACFEAATNFKYSKSIRVILIIEEKNGRKT